MREKSTHTNTHKPTKHIIKQTLTVARRHWLGAARRHGLLSGRREWPRRAPKRRVAGGEALLAVAAPHARRPWNRGAAAPAVGRAGRAFCSAGGAVVVARARRARDRARCWRLLPGHALVARLHGELARKGAGAARLAHAGARRVAARQAGQAQLDGVSFRARRRRRDGVQATAARHARLDVFF